MADSANYMQAGRWGQCAWCGTVYRFDMSPTQRSQYVGGQVVWESNDVHWCDAPWQKKPHDVGDFVPGRSPLTEKHYPESPFMRMFQPNWGSAASEEISKMGVPCH